MIKFLFTILLFSQLTHTMHLESVTARIYTGLPRLKLTRTTSTKGNVSLQKAQEKANHFSFLTTFKQRCKTTLITTTFTKSKKKWKAFHSPEYFIAPFLWYARAVRKCYFDTLMQASIDPSLSDTMKDLIEKLIKLNAKRFFYGHIYSAKQKNDMENEIEKSCEKLLNDNQINPDEFDKKCLKCKYLHAYEKIHKEFNAYLDEFVLTSPSCVKKAFNDIVEILNIKTYQDLFDI